MTLIRSASLALMLALAVAACGRKGALEPPPGAPVAATPAPTTPAAPGVPRDEVDEARPAVTPSGSLQRPGASLDTDGTGPIVRDQVRPDRPFFLDALL